MDKTELHYVTYIRSSIDKVWAAITNPEFTHQYWGGHDNISKWAKGAKWQHVDKATQTVRVVGEVTEYSPNTRLAVTWAEPSDLSDCSKVTFELETIEDMVCLKVTHSELLTGSEMASKVSGGWPRVLSSLKSFLETGKALNIRAGKCGCGK